MITSHTVMNCKRIKDHIKETAQMNTSAEVITELDKANKQIVAKAVEFAKADGRKTVMARDIQKATSSLEGQ